jgi:hypothetical protein
MEVKEYDLHVENARARLGFVVGVASEPLHVGHLYRAALHLAGYEKPFAGLIQGKLEKAGFADVHVYDDANTLPVWFGDLKDTPNATHWGEGVWRGEAEATPELPPQVIRVRDDGPGDAGPVGPPSPGNEGAWWAEAARIKAAQDLANQILDRARNGDGSVAKMAADELAAAVQAARDMARDAKSSAADAWQRVLDTLIKARDVATGAAKAGLAMGTGTIVLIVAGFVAWHYLASQARGEVRRRYVAMKRAESGSDA